MHASTSFCTSSQVEKSLCEKIEAAKNGDVIALHSEAGIVHISQQPTVDTMSYKTYTYTPLYMCTYIHGSVHLYIHTSVHVYIHTSVHAYIHTFLHVYIHTSVHVELCGITNYQFQYVSPHSIMVLLRSRYTEC